MDHTIHTVMRLFKSVSCLIHSIILILCFDHICIKCLMSIIIVHYFNRPIIHIIPFMPPHPPYWPIYLLRLPLMKHSSKISANQIPVATLTVKVIFNSLKISQIIPIVVTHDTKYVAQKSTTIPRKEPSALKKFFHNSMLITFFQEFSFYSNPTNPQLIFKFYFILSSSSL